MTSIPAQPSAHDRLEPAAALMSCLERYQAALLDYEDHTAIVSQPNAPASALRDHLDSAEQVITARLSMYRCLVELGWTPPPGATAVADVDRLVAQLTGGALGG